MISRGMGFVSTQPILLPDDRQSVVCSRIARQMRSGVAGIGTSATPVAMLEISLQKRYIPV